MFGERAECDLAESFLGSGLSMKIETHSGWHLTFDALVDDSNRIGDAAHLREFLWRLVRLLDMEVLEGPTVSEVALDHRLVGSDGDEGGITGYCLITTSHISIHTWPLRRRFCLDIFSCRHFDKNAALAEIRDSLGVSHGNVVWMERQWPVAALEVG